MPSVSNQPNINTLSGAMSARLKNSNLDRRGSVQSVASDYRFGQGKCLNLLWMIGSHLKYTCFSEEYDAKKAEKHEEEPQKLSQVSRFFGQDLDHFNEKLLFS